MSSVIVSVSTPADPYRLTRVYKPLVGYVFPGQSEAIVELSLEAFGQALDDVNLCFIGTVNFRAVKSVSPGKIVLEFAYFRLHDVPIETMEINFNVEDHSSVCDLLSRLGHLENFGALQPS